ncbi:MAG: hypothetical protein AAF702_04825 [Chloroflexota bacterium]
MHVEISNTEVITTHIITQTLHWNDASPLADRSYSHSLMLNDARQSDLGDGIFLDRAVRNFNRRPDHEPIVDFVPGTWEVLGRLGDKPAEKRFGVRLSSTAQIEDGVRYKIVWATPPGLPEDNGNIAMRLNGFIWSECSMFVEPWGLAPIPGEHSHFKPYAVCSSARDIYIPLWTWIRSFAEEEE